MNKKLKTLFFWNSDLNVFSNLLYTNLNKINIQSQTQKCSLNTQKQLNRFSFVTLAELVTWVLFYAILFSYFPFSSS